jgi:homoserine O-acetyltransferase
MSFPVITIADMVRAQYRLMQHLNIEKWLSVVGGSMGGMQAIEWGILYPESVRSICAIATTSRLSPQGIAFNWVGREAIMSDSNWNNGEYEGEVPEKGLATARMLAHITYLSEESMANKFGRNLQNNTDLSFGFEGDFAIESYLKYQGSRFVGRFDANSYLYITRALDYFDVSAGANNDLAEALKCITMPFLMVSFTSDWLFPPNQAKDIVDAMLKNGTNVTYCNIQSDYGHDAFLLEVETLGDLLKHFIKNRENS